MNHEDRVVDAKELEQIKQFIDGVKTKAKPLSSLRHIQVTTEETDLDERDKAIFNYIRGDQDLIKTNVIDAFDGKLGYSRKIVLRRIKRLEHLGMIIVKPDKNNRRIHHLLINNGNELVSLIADLDSFKQEYFKIIDKINCLVNDKHLIFTGLLGLIENLRLVTAVVTPFKIILKIYTTFDFLLPHNDDNEYLHRKFAIIHDTLKEIQNKLYNSVFKEPLVTPCDPFFTNTYLYDNLNLLNNILHGSILGSSYEDIEAMLITFNKCRLMEIAELLMDRLWKIIYPVFPIIYPRYSKDNPDVLRDWRRVMQNFSDFDTASQVSEYRKSMARMAITSGV
jgi:hypothetical protein